MMVCLWLRYILTLSDYFSKWVEAIVLPTKDATGVANQLYKVYIYSYTNCLFSYQLIFCQDFYEDGHSKTPNN